MWKIVTKEKYVQINDHAETQMWNRLVIVELLYGSQGKRERQRE
jgi:hypothetical protein